MKVFLSTVIRGAPVQRGGEVLVIDWDIQKIVARAPIIPPPPMSHDASARGGFRGGRGIVVLPDELFVASYHTLLGFTHDLKPTRTITHHNFSGLHELKLVEDGIWASSTPLSAIFKVGLDGQPLAEWWAHDDPVIQKEFGVAPLTLDKQADNRLAVVEDATKSRMHLNNVEVHDGRVYVSFNHHGAVVRLFPTEIVAHRPEFKGCHNGYVTRDGELLLNDSHHHQVIVFDLASGDVRRQINLIEFPEVARLARSNHYKNVPLGMRVRNFLLRKRMSRPLFTRGMCLLDDRRALVGVSPASVLELDFKQGKLLNLFQVSDAVNECVHGLEAIPSADYPNLG